MKRLLGTIFTVMGLLEIIILSAISVIDDTFYSDKNHFVGFMSNYDLWIFMFGSLIMLVIGIIMITAKNKNA